jgi:hypothetical protein
MQTARVEKLLYQLRLWQNSLLGEKLVCKLPVMAKYPVGGKNLKLRVKSKYPVGGKALKLCVMSKYPVSGQGAC